MESVMIILIKHLEIQNQILRLYSLMDETVSMQKIALKAMVSRGQKYPEIKKFKKLPGIGEVSAHIFDAFIQTPAGWGSQIVTVMVSR